MSRRSTRIATPKIDKDFVYTMPSKGKQKGKQGRQPKQPASGNKLIEEIVELEVDPPSDHEYEAEEEEHSETASETDSDNVPASESDNNDSDDDDDEEDSDDDLDKQIVELSEKTKNLNVWLF